MKLQSITKDLLFFQRENKINNEEREKNKKKINEMISGMEINEREREREREKRVK